MLVVALAFLVGCGSPPSRAPRPARPEQSAPEPYVLGAMFALTGDASSLGIPQRNTAQMLERMVNDGGGIDGHRVRILIEDTRGDPAEALLAARRLVERDQVLAIVGPSRTGTTLALVEYMDRVEVPLVSCAAGVQIVEPARKWVFKTPQTDRMAVAKLVDHLVTHGISRAGLLSDTTEFGRCGLMEIEVLLADAGIEVVAKDEYGPADASMVTQLTRIAISKPQAVICWGTPPGPAIVAREMKQLGMDLPLLCSHGVANETFLTIAGDAANGVVLPAGRLIVAGQTPAEDRQKAALQEYVEPYQAEFGTRADSFGGYAWDALRLVVSALREAGADRAGIRDAIEQTTGFPGVTGVFEFSPQDHNGLTKDSFVMVEVVDRQWRLVK